MSEVENVIVLPADAVRAKCDFQGYRTFWGPKRDAALDSILTIGESFNMRRGDVEDDPTYKQVVVYGIVHAQNGRILRYARRKGGETRLDAKLSIGIGGHAGPDDIRALPGKDAAGRPQWAFALPVAMRRELAEELDGAPVLGMSLTGLINDDSNAVGSVHLGFVYHIYINSNEIEPRDDSGIGEHAWVKPSLLLEDVARCESWSQIVIRGMAASADYGLKALGSSPRVS